jgi:hypothetical protein
MLNISRKNDALKPRFVPFDKPSANAAQNASGKKHRVLDMFRSSKNENISSVAPASNTSKFVKTAGFVRQLSLPLKVTLGGVAASVLALAGFGLYAAIPHIAALGATLAVSPVAPVVLITIGATVALIAIVTVAVKLRKHVLEHRKLKFAMAQNNRSISEFTNEDAFNFPDPSVDDDQLSMSSDEGSLRSTVSQVDLGREAPPAGIVQQRAEAFQSPWQ